MIGRLGFGLIQARSSRYVVFAAMLPIALLALVPMVRAHWARALSPQAARVTKMVSLVLFVPFILLGGLSFFATLPLWPVLRQARLYEKALVTFINVVPEQADLITRMYSNDERVRTAANALNRIGYLRPPLLQSNLVRNVADPTSTGSPRFGQFQSPSQTGIFDGATSGPIVLTGQAFRPDKRGRADAVLITYDNFEGEPVICAIAPVEGPPEDKVKVAWDPSALSSRWRRLLPKNRLPHEGKYVLKAWSHNAEACQAYPLRGSAIVER
jgi:hypothetical protein